MVVPGVHLAAVGSSAPAVDQIAKHLAETLPKSKQNLNINIFFSFCCIPRRWTDHSEGTLTLSDNVQ